MSARGMIVQVLVSGLCEAVRKDEESEGIDISAGLLGPHTSEWIRGVADEIVAPQPTTSFNALFVAAIHEAEKAMVKYPQPNYVISKIAEESGEVVKAAIHCAEGRDTIEHVREEMTQTIAMLYRLWCEGDLVHGCPPIGEDK